MVSTPFTPVEKFKIKAKCSHFFVCEHHCVPSDLWNPFVTIKNHQYETNRNTILHARRNKTTCSQEVNAVFQSLVLGKMGSYVNQNARYSLRIRIFHQHLFNSKKTSINKKGYQKRDWFCCYEPLPPKNCFLKNKNFAFHNRFIWRWEKKKKKLWPNKKMQICQHIWKSSVAKSLQMKSESRKFLQVTKSKYFNNTRI